MGIDWNAMVKSNTIRGIIILLANGIAKHLGFDIGEEVGPLADAIVNLLGASLAVYGRATVKNQIVAKKEQDAPNN